MMVGQAMLTVAISIASVMRHRPEQYGYLPDGRAHLDATVAAVRDRRPDLVAALDALHPVLAQAGSEAATRFEQTSGPVMAKGVEDSAYYRWARFVALNEVGVPCGPINTIAEGVALAEQLGLHPRVTVGEGDRAVDLIRNPITFSAADATYHTPPPELGEHTDAVREWLSTPG